MAADLGRAMGWAFTVVTVAEAGWEGKFAETVFAPHIAARASRTCTGPISAVTWARVATAASTHRPACRRRGPCGRFPGGGCPRGHVRLTGPGAGMGGPAGPPLAVSCVARAAFHGVASATCGRARWPGARWTYRG